MNSCSCAHSRPSAMQAPHVGAALDIAFDAQVNLAFTDYADTVPARLTEHSRRMAQRIYRVAGNVYCAVGYAISNIIFIVGTDGIIVIDTTETVASAQKIYADFCRIDPGFKALPVKALVYTHNHPDHIGGARAFVSEQQAATGAVPIIAHRSLMESIVNNANLVGPILATRSAYTFGLLLPTGATGKVNAGIGPELLAGRSGFLAPNQVFDEHLEITLAGISLQFRYAPSEADDEIVIWLPERQVLLSAEVIQGECLANIHTIRGTRYRDPVRWYKTIDMLRTLGAGHMVPAHGRPVCGRAAVEEVLTTYRDAIQYIHDQAIRHMNLGLTPDELAEALPALPAHLARHPWLGEYYGTVKHSVRQVYVGQLGWFEGDPVSLDPLPRQERTRRLVRMMGGRDAVTGAARNALRESDWQWAAELLTMLVRLDPGDEEARALKAQALRQLGYRSENINWRNWYLTAAGELEHAYDNTSLPDDDGYVSPDILRAQPLANVLQRFCFVVDPGRCRGKHIVMAVALADRPGESYMLELRRGVVQVHAGSPLAAHLAIALDTGTLYAISRDVAGVPAHLGRGAIKVERGSVEEVVRFFENFDPQPKTLAPLAAR